MLRSIIFNKTVDNMSKLPDEKLQEVSDYTEFILKKYEDEMLQQDIQKLTSESTAYKFLEDEEDLYTVSDLKEKYNTNHE